MLLLVVQSCATILGVCTHLPRLRANRGQGQLRPRRVLLPLPRVSLQRDVRPGGGGIVRLFSVPSVQ